MLKIILTLINIRLRKFLPRKDVTATILFILFYFALWYVIKENGPNELCLVILLDPIFYHIKRKDVNFLKNNNKYRFIIYLEYLIYLLPLVFLYILDLNYLVILFFIFPFLITYLPKKDKRAIKLPFSLFYPIWHIYFRKYKGYLFIIISIIFLINGDIVDNTNLIKASVFLSLIFPIIINFEDIKIELYIPFSKNRGINFILKETKSYFKNLIIFNSIYIVLYVYISSRIEDVLFLIIVYIISSSIISFKYISKNTLLKSTLYIFFMCTIQYGSFLLLPYIYYESVKNINKIQC